MFMDQNDQYSENEYTTQSNLLIQCNPYQATNGIFHRTRTNSFTVCMEIQKTWNSPKQPCQKRMELEESTYLTSVKDGRQIVINLMGVTNALSLVQVLS